MIQRIQSLYLLIAAALMAILFFVPMAEYFNEAGERIANVSAGGLSVDDRITATDGAGIGWGMQLCLAAAVLVPFITIFLFKRRRVQIRLCYVAMALQLGAQLLIGYFLWLLGPVAGELKISTMTPACIVPLVCLILTYLALRAIKKDEALVRSLDRIR